MLVFSVGHLWEECVSAHVCSEHPAASAGKLGTCGADKRVRDSGRGASCVKGPCWYPRDLTNVHLLVNLESVVRVLCW